MAVSVPLALVRAHYRSSWNEIIRSAGSGGKAATIGMIALAAFFVFLPGVFAVRIGLALGGELAAASDTGVLHNWNGLQATFTIGFALLGSFRLKPAFPFTRFGRFPITPLQLLLADLPASLFEVFPLLGVAGLILTNVGLAIRMPAASPLVMLLALDGVVTMVTLTFIGAAILSAVGRSRIFTVTLVAAVVATPFFVGARGMRVVLKEWLPQFVQAIPGSRGYAGLLELRDGRTMAGLSGIAIATVASAALLVIAAAVHQRRLVAEVENAGWRIGGGGAFRFSTPASGISRLFLRQLFASGAVRGQFLMPLFFTLPAAFIVWLGRSATAEGRGLPDDIIWLVTRAGSAPWFAVVPLLAVGTNAQIWMNQFGWDRGGFRTLLLLPLEPRDILAGKLAGLARFTAMQVALGVVPLLVVRFPTIREAIVGVCVGGVTLVVSTAVGHAVSIRFPRGVDGTAGLQVPLSISWISPVTLIGIGAELAGVYAIAELIVKGAGIVALVLSFAGAIVLYRAILPRIAALLMENRERLLGM